MTVRRRPDRRRGTGHYVVVFHIYVGLVRVGAGQQEIVLSIDLAVVVEVNPAGDLPRVIQTVAIRVGATRRASRDWTTARHADSSQRHRLRILLLGDHQPRTAWPR